MSQSNSVGLIDLQIMWNRLIAVVDEQAQTLMRTAFSPIVRECGDLSAGVFDLEGRMLAQAVTGTPGHVNSMAESVKHFLRYFPVETMKAGDAYITNDPWMGTGHLNDFVITTPCFRNGKLVASFPVEESDQIMLVTDKGQLIRCPVEGIRIAGRSTQGVIVFNTAEDEHVVSVEHIGEEAENGERTNGE